MRITHPAGHWERTESATRPEGLSAYIAVTAAYWAFMLTYGALRMLVLLHFHMLGFSPVQLAYQGHEKRLAEACSSKRKPRSSLLRYCGDT